MIDLPGTAAIDDRAMMMHAVYSAFANLHVRALRIIIGPIGRRF